MALVIRHEQFRIASVGWGLAPGLQPEACIGANMGAELEVRYCWFRCRNWVWSEVLDQLKLEEKRKD